MAVLVGIGLGQGWQQNGAQGNTQHAGWQLHQTVGVIHPGDRACDQKGGENSVDDQ
ncbi:hypothetical protein D3C75_1210970 [compost metagenome]